MEILEQMNNDTYKNETIILFSNNFLDSNEQNNILIFEKICDTFLKNKMYRQITLVKSDSDSYTLININKNKNGYNYTIFCIKEYFKYIINIAKKYPQICQLKLTPHEDINDDLCELLSSSSHIKKYDFGENFIEHLSFDWKKTYIRHINIYEDDEEENNNKNKIFFEWFKQNPQIYSLVNADHNTDKLIYEFLINNPQYPFMHINGTQFSVIAVFFKNKRTNMYNTIKIMLLISNHQHKFKKYAPKYIIRMILEYLYDIDYLKIYHQSL